MLLPAQGWGMYVVVEDSCHQPVNIRNSRVSSMGCSLQPPCHVQLNRQGEGVEPCGSSTDTCSGPQLQAYHACQHGAQACCSMANSLWHAGRGIAGHLTLTRACQKAHKALLPSAQNLGSHQPQGLRLPLSPGWQSTLNNTKGSPICRLQL